MISRHVIFILLTDNNGLLIMTIDTSDLLFRYQREDSVHQLPFQGMFWSSRTIFNMVGSADIAKLACGIHFVDAHQHQPVIASNNQCTVRRSVASIVTRIDKMVVCNLFQIQNSDLFFCHEERLFDDSISHQYVD